MKRILLLSLCTFLCYICDAQNTVNINWKDSISKAIAKSNHTDTNTGGIFISPIMVQQQSGNCCTPKKSATKSNNTNIGLNIEANLTLEWIKQYKLDIEAEIDAKTKEFNDSVNKKKEILDVYDKYLTFRENNIDRWLAVLGILFTFFGIVTPVAGFYLRYRLVSSINKQQEEVNTEVEKMKKEVAQKISDAHNETDKIKMAMNIKMKEVDDCVTTIKSNTDTSNEYATRSKTASQKAIQILEDLTEKMNIAEKSNNKTTTTEIENQIENADQMVNKIQPSSFEGDYMRALKSYLRNDYTKAEILLKDILIKYNQSMTNEEISRINSYLGFCLIETGKNLEAISYYTTSILYNPLNTTSYHNRAIAYSNIREYEKAILDYNKTIELDEGFENVYSHIGIVYHKMGDIEKAKLYYQKAIKNKNTGIAHILNLSELLLLEGNIDEAQKIINTSNNGSTPTNKVGYIYLKSIINILKGETKKIDETVNELKQLNINNDDVSWNLFDMIEWLNSDKSKNISQEKKNLIQSLINVVKTIFPKCKVDRE